MKRESIRNRRAWDIHHRRWQDIIAFLGGGWLIATVAFTVATATFLSGVLAFIGGALIVLMAAGAMQDDSAVYSWAAAAGGLIAVVGGLIAFFYGEMFAFWSLIIGGGVVLFAEVWSAALKRRAHEHGERRVEGGQAVRTY